MATFRDIYDEIQRIAREKQIPDWKHLCKTTEELGELATEINRGLGTKGRKDLTDADIRMNVMEEAADTVQCIIAVISSYNITEQEFVDMLVKKTKKWNRPRS